MEIEPASRPETPAPDSTRPWPRWLYVLFAILGPLTLSIAFAPYFGGDFKWLYPFALPVWSYAVTAVKIVAMFAWIIRGRRAAVPRAIATIGAWVFLVGGLHALFAAASNLLFSLMNPLAFLSMAAALMAGVCYLHAYCEIRPASIDTYHLPFRGVMSRASVAALAFGAASVILFFHRSPIFP
ncbi:MAG: hypothetical protein NT031_20015 [Planctomycetota bacterium]|nr:hypothetical protein [Planctomycetota bacterium]